MKSRNAALPTHRRVNITLAEDTLALINRVAKGVNRSRLIDQAVRRYIAVRGRAKLQEQLKAGALRRAERDRALTAEWFSLEEELWRIRRT